MVRSKNKWITIIFNNQNKNKTKEQQTHGKEESNFQSYHIKTTQCPNFNNNNNYRAYKENKAYSMEKDKLTETIPAETLLEKGFKTIVLSMLRAKIQTKK